MSLFDIFKKPSPSPKILCETISVNFIDKNYDQGLKALKTLDQTEAVKGNTGNASYQKAYFAMAESYFGVMPEEIIADVFFHDYKKSDYKTYKQNNPFIIKKLDMAYKLILNLADKTDKQNSNEKDYSNKIKAAELLFLTNKITGLNSGHYDDIPKIAAELVRGGKIIAGISAYERLIETSSYQDEIIVYDNLIRGNKNDKKSDQTNFFELITKSTKKEIWPEEADYLKLMVQKHENSLQNFLLGNNWLKNVSPEVQKKTLSAIANIKTKLPSDEILHLQSNLDNMAEHTRKLEELKL